MSTFESSTGAYRSMPLGLLLDGIPDRSEVVHRLAAHFLVTTGEAEQAVVVLYATSEKGDYVPSGCESNERGAL